MLYLLLGPDDYSKKAYITALVKDKGADLACYEPDTELPNASRFTEADLFARPKVFVFDGFMPPMGESFENITKSANCLVAAINSLDKRKQENKALLARKDVLVKEFILPHGLELNKWIEQRMSSLGGKASRLAVDELAIRLGRDNAKITKVAGKVVAVAESYNLWQAESELNKLMAYAAGRQVEVEDVQAIVPVNLEMDVFEITNAIGEGQKQKTFNLMQQFISQEAAGDEKSAVIQLNALLSEQMRSLAIILDFMKSKVSDGEIIKQTGWKSGRLYIMKKNSARLALPKIQETMKKLEALDEELKTSQMPAQVLLDLILAQIF